MEPRFYVLAMDLSTDSAPSLSSSATYESISIPCLCLTVSETISLELELLLQGRGEL